MSTMEEELATMDAMPDDQVGLSDAGHPAPKYDIPEDAQSEDAEPKEKDDAPELPASYREYGFTEEEAKALHGSGQLETVMGLLDRRFSQAGREKLQPEPEPEPEKDPFSVVLKAEEGYDETVVTQFTTMAEAANALHKRVRTLEAMLESQQSEVFVREMDEYFNALPEEYEAIYGKGTVNDMDPKSREFAAREAFVSREMRALITGYEASGAPVPPMKTVAERVRRMLHGDLDREAARRKGVEQARDAKGQYTARPTNREGKPMTGMERAVKRIEAFQKKHGID